MSKQLSPWCKRAKIAMIEQGITGVKLAKDLKYNRSYVASILNGGEKSLLAIKKISDYLNISDSDKEEIGDR